MFKCTKRGRSLCLDKVILAVTWLRVTRYTGREKQTGGSQSVSNHPTAVTHPHHHPIVLLLRTQTLQRFTEHSGRDKTSFYAH